ncbi:hypothetical protein Tco_0863698 [Tanacetum coccineum]
MVSAIASASSFSEYSWSESRLKSGDLNLSRLRVLKCDSSNSIHLYSNPNTDPNRMPLTKAKASVPDDRYAVSNGSGYAVLICWDEYAIFDRNLDTPYLMEVDTPTPCHALPETRDKQSVGFVSKKGKNLAPKSNISASVPDDRYDVSNGSGYSILICWDEYAIFDRKLDTPYLMEVDTQFSMHGYAVSSLMDTAYWSSE